MRAVEVDVTFIIFHCGKAERIGFRHRETQTLYLSELIDPSTVEKFGKIQIGLQLAIVKDVLEREAALPPTKKRPVEPITSGQPSKRQKTAHETQDVDSNPSAELVSLALYCFEPGLIICLAFDFIGLSESRPYLPRSRVISFSCSFFFFPC